MTGAPGGASHPGWSQPGWGLPGYGPAAPEEMDAAAALARQGFGIPRERFDRAVALFGPESLRLARSEGTPHGVAALWTMDQWFGGRPVPAQGVACVAIDPARRGRGHGGALVRAFLEDGRATGAAVSTLYPATLPLYARAGYGRAGLCLDWSAPPLTFGASRPPDGRIVPIDAGDATPLAALRRPLLGIGNGLIERTEALWTFALCPEGERADLYRLDGPDGPEGYIAVTPPRRGTLTVADHALPTPRAARLALAFLAGYRAQVDRVLWRGGPDDPLALLAPETGAKVEAREEWLLRILDVARALTARGYPPDVCAELRLDVTDPLFPDNCGTFHLSVAGGQGHVTRAESEIPAITLPIGALATLFCAHKNARLLRMVGVVDGTDCAISIATHIFAGANPWTPDRF